MSQSINDILNQFREDAANNRDLGDKFERLIANFLTKDPLYAELYSNVWLWMEWPARGNKPDTGIDLVAEERATGDLTAIQCKFVDPAYHLQKEDIDSFFTTSGKAPFKRRMIVSTTDKWSKHAEDACANQQIPVSRLRVQDLDDSPIDWSDFKINRPQDIKLKKKKDTRPHQANAIEKVLDGFKKADRGKLIMACGTGKTLVALKIAESFVPNGGNVLFLVPSISLISQTLTEWTSEAKHPLSSFAVCSDSKVGDKRNEQEDITTHDLAFPAHTDPRLLVKQVRGGKTVRKNNITAIFSTYQSISVVAEAQKLGLPEFDLVICDEAHRTTGVEQDSKDFSNFIAVHKEDYIRAKKRLYMTATPRIYDDASKGKAKDAEIAIYSMDDAAVYGEEFHRLDFSEAVRKGLLTDYKVMVLAVDEKFISKAFQHQIADANNEIALDDVVKIVGCYNGLKKRFIDAEGKEPNAIDSTPMRRAVAFNRSIKDSKTITELFSGIINQYQGKPDADSGEQTNPEFLRCEVAHVDGTFNALLRNQKLQWLKADTTHDGNVCRILSNARCLSEGVDVPALDAVMFLNPRNSVVDVVQSVGRVMRKADKKQYGYIILPVGIPADVSPEEALNDNQKYKVVWQVLQALRAHDDRFNAIINQIELNEQRTDKIQIIGVGGGDGDGKAGEPVAVQTRFNFPHLEDWENAIFAKIVVKCGNRRYWEDWANNVAQIAERHITRIKALLESSNPTYREKFEKFLKGLRKTLNPSITEDDAIEMLSQHFITKPVFDALFEGYEFTKHNPVSKAMQKMLDLLEEQALEKETATLEDFYQSVRERIQGVDNAQGRQKIVLELYNNFFRTAFPRTADRLGIVYTPIEVVDFIIRSADDALRSEFGVGLTDKDVHILDPFTGTGTFIVRLLQSGIIQEKDLPRKFRDELHANEIILLAYYIAAINIEEAYHGQVKTEYEPFDGILLTDTFQLSEGKDSFDDVNFQTNSERAKKQNRRDIRVIIGNPPYSAGQKSENDNNKNFAYEMLDKQIQHSYAEASSATLQKNLYDSYIRAFRWASSRIKERGVICFISNASFIDGNSMDGMRQCLAEEFTSIYCFNLRGNARTSGEQRRKEMGSVFGEGTRTPVVITLLVKNPEKRGKCELRYHDIGDYLTREQKLEIISQCGSIRNVSWKHIKPNKHHDWINQRDEAFGFFMPVGSKETKGESDSHTLFITYSQGALTARDAWAYNFSKTHLSENMKRMIAFYNQQLEDYRKQCSKGTRIAVAEFIDPDPKQISWSGNVKADLERHRVAKFGSENIRQSSYRPFCRQMLYFGRQFNERVYRIPDIFPKVDSDNLVICVTGIGSAVGFGAFIIDDIPNFHFHDTGQCFPLYTYRSDEPKPVELDFGSIAESGRRLNVSDYALKEFRAAYKEQAIKKEDVFYYVYGIFHSAEYKTRFASDLSKMLPRIPYAADFWTFSKAGRKLAEIHLNYETAKPYSVKERRDELVLDESKLYQVEKMRFGKDGKEVDKTKIQFNSHITLTGIPLEAYEYFVNGKPAIEWIIDRYQLTRDKDSGILNNPNDWAAEHNDPQYILNLLKRIITVSIETMKIVKGLPPLSEQNG